MWGFATSMLKAQEAERTSKKTNIKNDIRVTVIS